MGGTQNFLDVCVSASQAYGGVLTDSHTEYLFSDLDSASTTILRLDTQGVGNRFGIFQQDLTPACNVRLPRRKKVTAGMLRLVTIWWTGRCAGRSSVVTP